jgi:hypothetical protein
MDMTFAWAWLLRGHMAVWPPLFPATAVQWPFHVKPLRGGASLVPDYRIAHRGSIMLCSADFPFSSLFACGMSALTRAQDVE